MQTFFGLNNLPAFFPPCALTIGNFDGVHQGHLALIQQLKTQADILKLPVVLYTFEPLAKEYFTNLPTSTRPPAVRISPLADKLRFLEATGAVDCVLVSEFNDEFAHISAEDFVSSLLIHTIHAKYVLIGEDFKFGFQRRGNLHFLQQFNFFKTEKIDPVLIDGAHVSSSMIRQKLLQGDFQGAERLLGHPYALSGIVKHGRKLGRTLGCPTANIDLCTHRFPLHGIYVTEVEGPPGKYRGVASFGTNPTVDDDPTPKFEVHLLDFDGDLYGQELTVTFKAKIRDEIKFDNLQALKECIHQDMHFAKAYFG